MASSSSYNSFCAACKFLRRKCMPECIFAPYIPPEEPQKFANVHKIFGASNISKLLNELLPYQREDAVNSLAYEAEVRLRDPVCGCVGAISFLQRQVKRLQKKLDAANANLICYACNEMPTAMTTSHGVNQRNAYCNNDTGEILLQIDALEGGLDGDITGLRKQVGHLKHQMTLTKAQGGMKNNMKRMSKTFIKEESNHVMHVALFALFVFFVIYLWSKFYENENKHKFLLHPARDCI